MNNPVLDKQFSINLKKYLNNLSPDVKKNAKKCTHAIKTYLMQQGLSEESIGWANHIKVSIKRFVNQEFLFDAVGRVPNLEHPSEDIDLTFVAESENDPRIEKILEDANKLPIVRTDARLMFFKANDREQLEYSFQRLHHLFTNHRRSEVGDVYIMAGLDNKTGTYFVRKLKIQKERANESEWEFID